ncbi:MAG: glutamate--cysteine ligase [Bdellovibrionaceae bacterium]|nr:glutamate--cysteine ligase [Pseudobdellovibrionaceae bacterium]|tara:strand:- start:1597 stop:2856 length:1260 start_codon:yes stop_codon:yes gene_type:complete
MKNELAEKVYKKWEDVQEWFLSKSVDAPMPFYSSVDIRDSGFKIVPVDHNLFPAGFNNICEKDQDAASLIFKNLIQRSFGEIKNILILPENNTSNQYYIENLFYLREMIRQAGYTVGIGWHQPDSEKKDPILLETPRGEKLTAYPTRIEERLLKTDEMTPDFIVLNNDFSSGYPLELDCVSQRIVPTYKLGWHSRKKGTHFKYYNELAKEFAELIGIDPWKLTIHTETVGPVNFNETAGLREVAEAVEKVITETQKSYDEHSISTTPKVFIKNNTGTYGMGIMTASSPEEILTLNRRKKNKMSVGKNKSEIRSVVVQEGVPTDLKVGEHAAEPVVYLAGCQLIGGFVRSNTERGDLDNLNSKGMIFEKLCMSDLGRMSVSDTFESTNIPLLELVYGSIARLSALAAGREILDTQANNVK